MPVNPVGRRSTPSPIVVSPSGDFDGNDGPWSTFAFRVGTPAQVVKLLIDTSGQKTKVIGAEGCEGRDQTTCPGDRGYIFNSFTSTTWQTVGRFIMGEQQHLGYRAAADYGFDTVGLDWQGSGGPTLPKQIVGRTPSGDFWIGLFGVSPRPSNFTNFNDPQPSYLTSLKAANLIPSLSYGYTAGAFYQFQGVLGSLTLGGIDSSLVVPNSLSFPLSAVTDRDTVVGVSSISSSTVNGISTLSSETFFAFVDAGTPHIWLPLSVCQAFEKAFNLTYNDNSNLYLVKDAQHTNLLALNPSITFTITSGSTAGAPTIKIALPYKSFDLLATSTYPGLRNQSSRYFPIRRAANNTQYTLGRTFLQEAYLTVDYERANFSIHQRIFDTNKPKAIVAITSPTNANTTSPLIPTTSHKDSSHGISAGAIAGIVVTFVAVVALAMLFYFFKRHKRRSNRSELEGETKLTGEVPNNEIFEMQAQNQQRMELDAKDAVTRVELDSERKIQRFELGGDLLIRHELPAEPLERKMSWEEETTRAVT